MYGPQSNKCVADSSTSLMELAYGPYVTRMMDVQRTTVVGFHCDVFVSYYHSSITILLRGK